MNTPASTLQVMAHPDDDLFFVNPAILQGLKNGTRTTTVYLTSGDSDGRNPRPWQSDPVIEDRAAYGKARQNGIKAAYAAMTLGDRTAPWKAMTLTTAEGPVAEVFSLNGAPWVTLIFLNIRQHGTPEGLPRSLHVLWREETERVPTLVLSDGLVQEQHWYTRTGLVQTLVQIMDIVRPTVIRSLDPDPDRLVHNERFPQRHDYRDLSDHCDHTAAALFTWLALNRYQGPAEGRTFTVEAFRGYYNERWPHNLGIRAVAQKELFLNLYAAADGYDCGDPAGSGDYSVGLASRMTGWVQSTNPRYPGGTNWLQADRSGRLTAFAVVNQQAAVWLETQPGTGQWRGPFLLGGGPLAPGLAVCLTPDGRWQIFAERLSRLAADDAHTREIVLLEQTEPGGGFGTWTSLGNPSAGAPHRDRHLGTPVAVRDGAGRVHLFVRNAGQGLHTRVGMPDGTWSGWTDLRGHELQEGLTAVTAASGQVDVFGASREAVFRWGHRSLSEPLVRAPRFRLAPSAGPVTAVLQPSGRVMTAYREPDTGNVLVAQEDAPGGNWAEPAKSVGGRGGYGAVALAAGPSEQTGTLVACRSDLGGVAHRFLPGDQPWRELSTEALGGAFVGAPAAAFDAQGRAVIAVIGADARLATARQTEPGAPEFDDWTIVG
ncbi:PIG-L family deacetylase [Streptomyces sp. SID4985]|uniref:PIG-L family deacetylase n=1 Tax=unclassified Streptomyces TaxID=2593676 RepID=UPI00136EFC5F|nr:hypothetical protein [Streptomyces sp. SID4985]